MNLASCPEDATALKVVDWRRGPGTAVLVMSCPSCARRFVLGADGPEETQTA